MERELSLRDAAMQMALDIQRTKDPKDWRRLVDKIENADQRAIVDDYLRGIVYRMNVVRRMKAADNRRP